MNRGTLVRRSLAFYARSHLGAFLGAAVGSAVLVGALVVGDSVRGSLREFALARIGKVSLALASRDRLFRESLRDEFGRAWPGIVSSDLFILGSASRADESARANQVHLLGADAAFWKLAPQPGEPPLGPGRVAVNAALARQLGVRPGETIILRAQNLTDVSRDTPLSPEANASTALRLEVSAVVDDAHFGRFSLQSSQLPPFNAYVDLAFLQRQLQLHRQANLLLCQDTSAQPASAQLAAAARQLKTVWQLEDAGLELRELSETQRVSSGEALAEPQREIELRSKRVFIDAPISKAALACGRGAAGILTYFVNQFKAGPRETPYSMIAAAGPPWTPAEMRDDQILINRWLEEDLMARPNTRIDIRYYVMGKFGAPEERTADFLVYGAVPLGGLDNTSLMPDFPGMKSAENCRDWDTGLIPIDFDKIRPKDNQYWREYRGAPKAFITLAAGQRLWTNRFGNLTAVRWLAPAGADARAEKERLRAQLQRKIDPRDAGLFFQPSRELALRASEQAQDFGGLFIGFSFFLVTAALLLMAMLFQFGLERRSAEVGILLAIGFTPKQVRRQFLAEGAVLALLGGAVGLLGGIGYARGMLYGLSTIWRAAIASADLTYHASADTLLAGAFGAVIVCWITLGLALRRQAKQPAHQLLAEGGEQGQPLDQPSGRPWSLWIGVAAALLGGASLAYALATPGGDTPDNFFSAGTFLLAAALGFAAFFLRRIAQSAAKKKLTMSGLGIRNACRRRRRSLGAIALLACGSFVVASIGVFHLETPTVNSPKSGTGGFALIAESSIPIVEDLNSAKGRETYGLDEAAMKGVKIVPMRVQPGEEASCLNLNRAQRPRLLGVDPSLLDQRGAFTFAQAAAGLPTAHPWLLLEPAAAPDVIPAIGDEASIRWALGKNVGDTVEYEDEHGQKFKLRLVASLANSVLQGNLIVAQDAFVKKFPSVSGYRMFLIDAPANQAAAARKELSRALQDRGLEISLASARLEKFNAVQNTYLSTFQLLGGLGLILGSIGLGVVVWRNVYERRAELAVLMATGFRPGAIRWLVVSEHAALLGIGLLAGIVSALAAVWPSLTSPAARIPYASIAITLGAVLLSGLLWTWLAAFFALRGDLLAALRNE